MTEYKTEFLAKTRYISAKIVFIDKKDKKIPSIKIKHQIGANGICNIEKISQYWKYVTYKSDKFKPTSTRIQFAINSNDLYRPLSLAMFAVEYQIFEANPAPFHFINILLFI